MIYGDMPKDSILMSLSSIVKDSEKEDYDKDELLERTYREVKRILVLGTDYGFNDNLWHNYLTYLLITNENPFSLVSEKIGARDGSVNYYAMNDFEAFMELFRYDFNELEKKLDTDVLSHLLSYKSLKKPEQMYNRNVSEKVVDLSRKLESAKDVNEFFKYVTDFYKDYGVGMFGLNKAFRIQSDFNDRISFQAINNMDKVMLDDLIGYEIQKKQLVENTEAFVNGRKANNVLLYGDSGTGKSTSIKAIVNEFYDKGLRMIEIYKHQFKYLSDTIAQIKNRNYKFIIYMDDLSFEDFEIEYKFLKAVIEGGVETRPDNILIYATSNRRHLIKEMWKDKDDTETSMGIHRSDTVEEKLSLAYRFGVSILYTRPSHSEYYNIVLNLAKKNGIEMDNDELLALAEQWELKHGGVSGRCAQQFINHILGKMK